MKKIFVFSALVLGALLLSSCVKNEPIIDGNLIVGKWVNGTEYWRYDDDGNGATWDVGDDVTEEEAQPFTWSFESETNRLTQIHIMEMGGRIPKYYTVTSLDDKMMKYRDVTGNSYYFVRVN